MASFVAILKSLSALNLEFKFLFFFFYRSAAALAAPFFGGLVVRDLVDVGGEEVGLGAELLTRRQQHPQQRHLSLPRPLYLSLCRPTNFFVLPQLQGRMAASCAVIGREVAEWRLIG